MKCNVGKIDRLLRIFVGVFILTLGLLFQNWLGIIGIAPLVTGLVRWCPAYLPFGIKTQ
jgi:hypothetical protein